MLCQTTDSGSNNKVMAREMHLQFLEKNTIDSNGNCSYRWNPQTMHVFCFCHKLALIVNAGLAALGVKAPPPRKVKESDRGHFPLIESIAEEEEPIEDGLTVVPWGGGNSNSKQFEAEEELIEHDLQELEDAQPAEPIHKLDDEGKWDAADAKDEACPQLAIDENEAQPTHRREADNLDYILRKVNSQPFSPLYHDTSLLVWSTHTPFSSTS